MAHNGQVSPAVLVPMHLGDLHAYETALLVLLAFGPFVGLAVVVVVLRRRDAASGSSATESGADGSAPGGSDLGGRPAGTHG